MPSLTWVIWFVRWQTKEKTLFTKYPTLKNKENYKKATALKISNWKCSKQVNFIMRLFCPHYTATELSLHARVIATTTTTTAEGFTKVMFLFVLKRKFYHKLFP